MREILTVKMRDRYIVVPKLIGAMFIAIAALMLVYASVDAVTAWDRVKDVRKCIEAAALSDDPVSAYGLCVTKATAAGIYVYSSKVPVPDEEVWALMMPKAAAWLFWVTVLIIAILVYQWGKFAVPVQEEVVTEQVASEETMKAKGEKSLKRRGRPKKSSKSKK